MMFDINKSTSLGIENKGNANDNSKWAMEALRMNEM